MTYLPHPTHYTLAEFRALFHGLKFAKGWRPQFPTLHNTGVPSLKQWLGMGATPQERWGGNLNAYYKKLGWHSGPHLVVCPDYVWVLCDPEQDGVSVSCWNSITFGIEMVGNYEVGGDDFATGDGARVRDNAVFVLACLSDKFGWDIAKTLHLHRECEKDHHACPGSKVAKTDIIERVAALLESWKTGGAPVATLTGKTLAPAAAGSAANRAYDLSTLAGAQRALIALGYSCGRAGADGVLGPDTRAAIRRFEADQKIPQSGQYDSVVKGALTQALAPKAA